jgi:flagellar motor switch protein FliM
MESDSVLSREEIDALLSAIRDPEEKQKEPAVQAWDFRKPRRLLATELERIRALHAPLLDSIGRLCKKWLNAPVQVRLLAPAEGTFAELLEGRPVESCVARAGDVLLDPSPPVAFALVERALGGGRLSRPPDRPLRDLEAELLTPAMTALLEALAPAWSPAPPAPLRWGPASAFARESWPDGSCVLLGIEILSEGLLGDILVALPAAWFDMARPAAPEVKAHGVDIEIAARFPLASLRLGDLRELAPGDLLVWSGDSAPELTVEVSRKPQFVGRPGSLGGKAAVEILKPAGHEASPAALIRISGGVPSSGVPEVPVEVRAVLAERMMSLGDLAALRPGVRIEFPRPADAPVELRLGRWIVGRGPVIRSGDRLALKVESLDSGRRKL